MIWCAVKFNAMDYSLLCHLETNSPGESATTVTSKPKAQVGISIWMFFNVFISLTSTVSHSSSLITEVPTTKESAPTCSLKFQPVIRGSFLAFSSLATVGQLRTSSPFVVTFCYHKTSLVLPANCMLLTQPAGPKFTVCFPHLYVSIFVHPHLWCAQ